MNEELFSRRDLRQLMVPLILQQLLSLMVGLADAVMVAGVGNAAVSAVSLVDSVTVLMNVVLTALATGGGAVAGQYLGRKEPDRAREAGSLLMLLLLGMSLALTGLLYLFSDTVLGLLFGRAEEAIRTDCRTYYMIVMASVPFLAVSGGITSLFRIYGDSRTPMLVSLAVNAVNIAGNAVCIYGLGMGVDGAAIPSVISVALGMLAMLRLMAGRGFTMPLRQLRRAPFVRPILDGIVYIGLPSAVENGMFQIGKIALMSLVSTLSTASITANAIGNTVGNLRCFIGMGVNAGLTTIVSRCAGAGEYEQARRYTHRMLRLVYLLQGVTTVLLLAATPLINAMYQVTGEAARLSVQINLAHSIGTLLLWPIAFIPSSAMAAAGDSRYAMFVSAGAMWIGRVGLSYLLIRGFGFSVLSVWIAWSVDWVIRTAFFVPRWRGTKWQTKGVASA